MKTRILSQAQIRELITMDRAVEAVEAAFAAHGRGEALMPAKVYLDLPEHHGDFRAMPAYLDRAAGVKWVNSHPENPARHGLPSVMGVFVLSDPETAAPLAVMDFTWLTAVRTGAAGAVGTRHLARQDARTIGFVGSGVQARVLLDAHQAVREGLVPKMADADPAAAERFAEEAGGQAVTLEEVCACDIVCTATPSRQPVVRHEWVRAGAHINAMGADAPGKQELDPAILTGAILIIDDHHQATSSGEVNVPLSRGAIDEADIRATLGEVIAGRKPGRRTAEEITVFDSTGLAVQDVALARIVYDLALERDAGTEIELIAG